MNKQGPGRIDWTDYTWNPITGCWGPGGTAEKPKRCFYCYAQAMTERFYPLKMGWDSKDLFFPVFHPSRLEQPFAVKQPSKIFVCSTADLFGDWVPHEWIEAVLGIVHQHPRHTFQFLTKNPRRLAEFNPWPNNAWVGATAMDQKSYEEAWDLGGVQANVRFLSFEPLLGPINNIQTNVLNWLILGALTGRHAKAHPCPREWVEDIERAAAGVPVWEKDSLAAIMGGESWELRKEWPHGVA